MACYYCAECGNLKDGDWNVCSEDPRPGKDLELVCEDCIVEVEEQMEKEAKMPNNHTFTAEQMKVIKEAENADSEE